MERQHCVLLKFGEIVLRGRNRWRFYQQMHENVRRATRDLPDVKLQQRGGVLELRSSAPLDELYRRARDVIGAAVVHPATIVEKTPEAAAQIAVELLRGREGRTFAVRPRRRDKDFPLDSQELAILVGSRVQEALGLGVDLRRPDIELHLEVDRAEIYAYTEKLPGRGGLPVGTSGRALALISGGIDSPVAAYEIMRRGAEMSFAHVHSGPFTSAASVDKVRDLVGLLARHQGTTVLWVVPFGALQTEIVRGAPAAPRVILYRRFMLRVAQELAEREGARALVTGESLGQVSSQTLANLDTINRAARLPVLRPLIGTDKQDIVARARRIGTLDISNEPDQDCCSYLMPPRPATSTRAEILERIEAGLDTERLVRETLERAVLERIEPEPR